MALIVVAHDSTTSPQLHREIVFAVDEVCSSIAPGDELFKTLVSIFLLVAPAHLLIWKHHTGSHDLHKDFALLDNADTK
jgi:hypothetical protein